MGERDGECGARQFYARNVSKRVLWFLIYLFYSLLFQCMFAFSSPTGRTTTLSVRKQQMHTHKQRDKNFWQLYFLLKLLLVEQLLLFRVGFSSGEDMFQVYNIGIVGVP